MRPGNKIVQLGFKTSPALARIIDEERAIDEITITEFCNDALKYYIDYRVRKRLALWDFTKDHNEKGGK